MRYVVVGTSGCGKSTLAQAMARSLQVPWIELDALFWAPGWQPRRRSEFAEGVREAARAERWVADGNYSDVREVLWPRATHIVWLNFARHVVLPRVIARTFRRAVLREPLWHGNRETLRKSFFSRQSIIWWSLTTHGRNLRRYAGLRADAAWAHLEWIELRTPGQASDFLQSLRAPVAAGVTP